MARHHSHVARYLLVSLFVLALAVLPVIPAGQALLPCGPGQALAQEGDAPSLDIDIDIDEGGDWYTSPLWIAIFIIGGLVIIILIIMAMRGGGGRDRR
ncbi:MAG: hypothetical protein R6X25_06945 [Candidatus Krumholzibacteriia bacterium]